MYLIVKQKLTQGVIPYEATMYESESMTTAHDMFLDMCHQLGYKWRNTIESYNAYTIIAEAKGQDYFLTLSYHLNN